MSHIGANVTVFAAKAALYGLGHLVGQVLGWVAIALMLAWGSYVAVVEACKVAS